MQVPLYVVMWWVAGEIGEEFEERRGKDESVDDLMALVNQIVPYDMSHNAGKWPALRLCVSAAAESCGAAAGSNGSGQQAQRWGVAGELEASAAMSGCSVDQFLAYQQRDVRALDTRDTLEYVRSRKILWNAAGEQPLGHPPFAGLHAHTFWTLPSSSPPLPVPHHLKRVLC